MTMQIDLRLLTLVFAATTAGSAAHALEAGIAESCAACHRGPLSLADRQTESLTERIGALAVDQGSHPVAVPMLSPEDLALLADKLKELKAN
jgi:hypothetical protein